MQASDTWPARDSWIDERGHLCPAPVIALARAARTVARGEVVVVLADDPAAEFDIPAWCRMTGNFFISAASQDAGMAYAVRINAS
jgi:tRNA 2-thiouridine synthesizing protein A